MLSRFLINNGARLRSTWSNVKFGAEMRVERQLLLHDPQSNQLAFHPHPDNWPRNLAIIRCIPSVGNVIHVGVTALIRC